MSRIERAPPGGAHGALFSAAVAWERLVVIGGTTAWDGCPDGDVEMTCLAVRPRPPG